MYATCIFCRNRLGSNQALEEFPVGRRLAFDSVKGRLWVVCGRCARWNLSPLEERWEAVEACERLYRESRLRVATEEIGLARLREGTELIRIGRPLRPELAAWRYGNQLGRRRIQAAAQAAAGLAVGSAVIFGVSLGAGALLGAAFAGTAGQIGFHLYAAGRSFLRQPPQIRTDDGPLTEINPVYIPATRIRHTDESPNGWELVVQVAPTQTTALRGDAAEAAAAILLPHINKMGASRSDVQHAVSELEVVSDPKGYFVQAEFRARKRGYGYNPIAAMPKPIRLALEMAVHEEQERRAMEGELRLLERAWKEAEEIAAIADSLVTPPRIQTLLSRRQAPPPA